MDVVYLHNVYRSKNKPEHRLLCCSHISSHYWMGYRDVLYLHKVHRPKTNVNTQRLLCCFHISSHYRVSEWAIVCCAIFVIF